MFKSQASLDNSSRAQTLPNPTQPQADHERPIQDVLTWSNSELIVPQSGNSPADKYDDRHGFVPRSKLDSEFLKPGRIEELLDVLFGTSRHCRPRAETIRKFYLRPFVILICAGYGTMIGRFVEHQSLADNYLPFRERPPDFPASSASNLVWQRFNEHQWKFCAVKLHLNMSLTLGKYDILPIVRKTSKASGASAAISEIEIHPDYDQLHDEKNHNAQNSHTYALKTYNNGTSQARAYHEAERNAFEILSHASNRQENNVVSYYGSFTRVGVEREDISFNTIFEFAEYGTLEDFMKKMDPPSTAEDSNTFWERFLEVTRGLAFIHGHAPTDARMEDAILLGWHQDVKPKNILVCPNRNSSSKYDHTFKLADLGLSHFKMHVGASHSATGPDTFGTRTYGAPEVYRDHRRLASLHLDTKRDIDIWSMGCVLSEVAVWLVHGYQYLDEYRRRRSAEFHKQSGKNPADCFHDGRGNVLNFVKKTHEDLPDNFRKWDHCTGEVLDRLVSQMIKAGPRPPALIIYEYSREIIEGVKKQMNGGSTKIGNRPFSNMGQHRPKLPPNLPPGHERKIKHQAYESPFNQETKLQLDNSLDRANHQSLSHSRVSSNSGSPQRTTRWYGNENPLQAQSSRHAPTFVATGKSTGLVPAAGETDIPKTDVGGFSHRRMSSCVNTVPITPRGGTSQNNPFVVETEDTQGIFEARQVVLGRDTRNMALEDNGYRDPTDDTATASYLSINRQSAQAAALQPFGQAHMPQHQDDQVITENHRPPKEKLKAVLTVQDGLIWKRKRESDKSVQLPNKYMLDELKNRDHVFLVDTAKSMLEHQIQVKEVVELLGYMVSPCDPDGMELHVTWNGGQTRNWKSSNVTKFLEQLDKIHLLDRPYQPNFALPFGEIIENYQMRLSKKHFREKFGITARPPRKLSLYVITDGVWQPDCEKSVETTIGSLVGLLNERHLTNAQVVIQFIQVGDYADGKRRLKKLDSGLGLKLDIVDTTHVTENVWKMLHGSMSPYIDDD